MTDDFPRPIPAVLPEALAARPLVPKMNVPLPAFADLTFIGEEGYNLSAVDRRSVILFADRRWCWICGGSVPSAEDMWFLGDEQQYLQGYFVEPGGHEDCFLAALTLCPFIFNRRYQRASERKLGHPQVLEDPEKPVVWVLTSSRYYKTARQGRIGVHPRLLRNARYFAYDDAGHLREVSLSQANERLTAEGLDPIPTA